MNPIIQTNSASDTIIAGLQTRFGSVDYNSFQALRYQFFSYVKYNEAGVSQLNFFGDVPGNSGVTAFDTNMVKQGSFGQQHFILKSIATDIRIKSNNLTDFDGTDASTLSSDFLNGFVKAGVLELAIGARPFATVPKPFMYLPPVGAKPMISPVGLTSLTTAVVGAVGTMDTVVSDTPVVNQTRLRQNAYIVDPQILIEAEQNFSVSINFFSGIVPIIGTGITDDTTNPLQIGVILDGILLRPKQ